MNRRSFLKAAGFGTCSALVLGSGAAGWRAHEAGLLSPDDAPFAPWDALDSESIHNPKALAAAAILASNPHNTQPWQILLNETRFVIKADTERHLGAFDPYRREMWIGLGCAVANAEIVAPGVGFTAGEPEITGGLNGAGAISLEISKQSAKAHPLGVALQERRTNRGNYETTAIQKDVLNWIISAAGELAGAKVVFFDRDTQRGAAFADATLRGTATINTDKEMSHDGHVWFRGTARKVAKYRDGVSVPTAGLSPFISIMGQILPEADAETSGNYWLASTKRQLENCGGFGLIIVDDLYSRKSQIAAGRLWQRLHLALTMQRLAAHPMNQLPELVDRDRYLGTDRGWGETLTAITGPNGQATFAFRYGVPTIDVPHSARRPLNWVSASI